ncbi:MAG: AMP-binding protein [Acidobacteriia bacterium]|nr:AMP-binding protein [Terriglobia bacterium]
MKQAATVRSDALGNLAGLELENLERFGIYTRLHFEGRSYTNLEELQLAGSWARLLEDFGVSRDDRVLVMMPNSPELTAAFPGIWMLGAAIVPVIPQWTAAEVADILRNSDATVAVTVPRLAGRLKEASAAAGTLRHLLVLGESEAAGAINIEPLLAEAPPRETPANQSPSDLAILLYTSGTTGTPKGVMLTHGNFLAALEGALRQNPQMEPGAMLHTLPLTHVYGVIIQFLANRWGLATVLLPQFEPTRVLELIERYRVRYLPVVPTMLVYLLNHPERARYDTSSLFRITSGGAPLPDRLRLETERVFGCRIDQGYGLSETAAVATGYAIEAPYRAGSAGQATPGVEIRILDDQDQPLPAGSVGEICLAGANISPGYWKDPEATQRALDGGWLRTGDIGYLDEDGYLYITDRKKDLIIKGGENISPREIEEALYLHPAVAEAAVIGIPDAVFGEDVCAVVQLKPGAEATEEEMRRHVAQYVTKFKLPAKVVFMAALPKNSNAKILKRAIRDLVVQ